MGDSSSRDVVVIDTHNDDFGAVLNCAVRYALGRQSYMPGLIIDYITPLLPEINDRTLYVLDQDITEQKYCGGYGDPYIDEPLWMRFLEKIHEEQKRRGVEPYRDWRKDNDNR